MEKMKKQQEQKIQELKNRKKKKYLLTLLLHQLKYLIFQKTKKIRVLIKKMSLLF